jgi:N-acetylglucosaminyl-diphospho-decaprenol L-rhamnosyltransferase
VADVDVVVVSFNSARTLRSCVEQFEHVPDIHAIVVDNASTDESVDSIAGLDLTLLQLDSNHGFAYGCNRGWQAGGAPAVLFLNPDARISPEAVRQLEQVLNGSPSVGLVAPRIVDERGERENSMRRFPRLRSTYSRALFLHRVFRFAAWSDELIRDPKVYERPGKAEWVSGACMLVRRSALERLGGWDESFFLYCEDVDLCRRLFLEGLEVRYEPSATASHVGGASAPRPSLLPRLVASRLHYARLHDSRLVALLQRVGVAIEELMRAVVTPEGEGARAGHVRAFRLACSPRRDPGLERLGPSRAGPAP